MRLARSAGIRDDRIERFAQNAGLPCLPVEVAPPMKILLLADIHANWPALQAVDEDFDACLFLGDVVDYATMPLPCLEWVRDHATYVVRGNHDHSVAQRVKVTEGGTFRQLARAMRPLHLDVLQDEHLTWLAKMPVTQHIELDGMSFLLVHATPRDPMDEYIAHGRRGETQLQEPDLADQWASRLTFVEADIVCVGHTHIPLDLQLDGCRVINPGSVGQPRDGDPRAAYAVMENGNVSFRRVEYDIQATLRHMQESGIPEEIVAGAGRILTSGGNPAGQVGASEPTR